MSQAEQTLDGTRLRQAIRAAARAFDNNKKKLRDLSPRFWVALMDMEITAADDNATVDGLIQAVKNNHQQLGSPGDFGYGTPCGEALREVYDACSALCAAKKAANEAGRSQEVQS
jgi:hypothetical protein